MKLSKTAKRLLLLIDSNTIIDPETGRLIRYWVPSHSVIGDWCEHLGEYVFVGGAGDARCLISLCDKGLIKEQPVQKYSYSITEEGRMVVDNILSGMGLQRKPYQN